MMSLYPERPVLLVDDEEDALVSMRVTLQTAQISNIICCQKGKEALDAIDNTGAELVVLDLIMLEMSGQQVLAELSESHPDIPVIMVTGVNDVETAVHCIKSGAHDYILKPIESERFIRSVQNALKLKSLEKDYSILKDEVLLVDLNTPAAFEGIVTRSPKMRALLKYVEAVAKTSHPILITGESGVGKELIARAIHQISGRRGELVALNVAGLDDTLLSDTLFGHTKGAYTGADNRRKGLVEQAANGTLFLDEIGDLTNASQIKLLRLIQEKEYFPLGQDIPNAAHVRIVAATCKDLTTLRDSKLFRKDLFYRLNTHHIHIPPLRERKEDIELLTEYFWETCSEEMNISKPKVPHELLSLLSSYPFEGNIRELKSLVIDVMTLCKGDKIPYDYIKTKLGEKIESAPWDFRDSVELFQHLEFLPTLKEAQHVLIEEAIRRTNGTLSSAARLLGITPQALGQRIKRRV